MTNSHFWENRYIVIRVSRIVVVNTEWMGVKIKFSVQLSVETPNTNSIENLFVVLEVKSVDGNKLFVRVFCCWLCAKNAWCKKYFV